MSRNTPKMAVIPTEDEVTKERERLKRKSRRYRILRNIAGTLLVVAAVSVLLATVFLPVLQVSGTSMEPSLEDGDIIVLSGSSSIERGDIIGFYYQNKLLLKRVIGLPGDLIDIDEEGNVTRNGTLLDEPYVSERALGESDLTYPYQVPDDQYFVMGDCRAESIDSRNSVIGCIDKDQILGKVIIRVWPLNRISIDM